MPNWENLPPLKDTGDSLSADELNAIVDGVKKLDGTLDANSNAIENLPAPVNNNDAARKAYVDSGLSGKANSTHTHSISDVTGLMDAIDGIEGELSLKASLSHTHSISDVTDLQAELDAKLESVEITDIEATGTASGTTYLRGDGTWSTPSGGGTSDWGDIGGTLSDQTDLQSALDGKANSSHTHNISDINATGTASSNTFLRGDGVWQRPSISGLSGVNLSGVTDGQVLAYNSGIALWMPTTPSGGGASELADLDDVTLTTPSNGQALVYASGDWINRPTYLAPDLFANRPAANTVAPGTVFAAIDVSYKHWISDGTNWTAYFQGHPVTEPPAAVNWTAFGNGSWALTNEGGYLKCKSTMGSTVKRNFFVVPLPVGTGWTIETELLVYHGSGSTPGHAGLAVVNSTDPITDSATFGYRAVAAYHSNQSRQYGVNIFSGTDLTSATSVQQGFMGDLSAMTTTNSHRFRVRRTPTWFIFELTVNGYSWDMNYAWNPSVGVGANPTHIGIYTSHAQAAGYELNEINVVNWRQY